MAPTVMVVVEENSLKLILALEVDKPSTLDVAELVELEFCV